MYNHLSIEVCTAVCTHERAREAEKEGEREEGVRETELVVDLD